MNKLTIIGNLTRDPELRTTSTGINVCTFTVAVNRRQRSQNANQPETDFFRVTAWRQLGEICQKYLSKGRKVAVVGPVSVSSYTANDGSTRFSLEVTADDVEFLSSRSDGDGYTSTVPVASARPAATAPAAEEGFDEVEEEELPF